MARDIRLCDQSDIPWLVEWLEEHYAKEIKDSTQLKTWVETMLMSPENTAFWRTETSAIFAICEASFYDPTPVVDVQLFAGNIWEMPALFREAIAWGKTHGANKLVFASSTGVDVSPLAMRLGATTEIPTYSMEI